MEGRVRRRASPGRTKVWVEPPQAKSQKLPQPPSPGKRVSVVYYLCRNRQLEHPHFIEVPLASPEGLYLRDVISRLNVLRGKGMAAMYSWSFKRSYKSGFVWHDLSEDDLVLPTQGNEYILKGSELLDQSPPDRQQNSTNKPKVQSLKHTQEKSPPSQGSRKGCSPSLSPAVVIKEVPPPQPQPQPALPPPSPSASTTTTPDDEQCRTPRSRSSGNLSPEPRGRNTPSSRASSPGLAEYNVHNPIGAQDASTQTDDRDRRICKKDAHPASVSTKDGASHAELQEGHHTSTQASPKGHETVQELPPLGSSGAARRGRAETLESLIRAEASRRSSLRALEEEDVFGTVGVKKPTNLLMQLITCGSITVNDHRGLGLIPAYRPRFTQPAVLSPVLSTPSVERRLDNFSGNPRTIGVQAPESECSGGSLPETKKQVESGKKGVSTLKRSSSYDDEDRVYKAEEPENEKESLVETASIKCLAQTIKMISCKQSRNGPMPPASNVRNNSGQQECSSKSSPLDSSKSTSTRMTDPSSEKIPSSRVESFHEEREKVIKIEESLLLELGL